MLADLAEWPRYEWAWRLQSYNPGGGVLVRYYRKACTATASSVDKKRIFIARAANLTAFKSNKFTSKRQSFVVLIKKTFNFGFLPFNLCHLNLVFRA